jgi:hypothetical protein
LREYQCGTKEKKEAMQPESHMSSPAYASAA